MTDREIILKECKRIDNVINVVEEPMQTGVRIRAWFDNGFGASIVRFEGSYGYRRKLWEVAVLIGNEEKYDLCYDTEITDDVIGELTVGEVIKIANNISKLEADNVSK